MVRPPKQEYKLGFVSQKQFIQDCRYLTHFPEDPVLPPENHNPDKGRRRLRTSHRHSHGPRTSPETPVSPAKGFPLERPPFPEFRPRLRSQPGSPAPLFRLLTLKVKFVPGVGRLYVACPARSCRRPSRAGFLIVRASAPATLPWGSPPASRSEECPLTVPVTARERRLGPDRRPKTLVTAVRGRPLSPLSPFLLLRVKQGTRATRTERHLSGWRP